MDFFGLTQEPPSLPGLIYGLGEVFCGHHFEGAADSQLNIIISGVGGDPGCLLRLGNNQKSQGLRSGLYGGWGMISTPFETKKSVVALHC